MIAWVALLGLGAGTAVDTYSFLQLMISQPLVAGWLAGCILGEPGAGLAVGLLLQLIWIRDLPMGGRAAPAAGPAAVVGVLAAAASLSAGGAPLVLGRLVFPEAPTLALVLLVSLLVGEAGRKIAARRVRSRVSWVRQVEGTAGESGEPPWRFNLRGIGESALIGLVLTAGGWAAWVCLRSAAPVLAAADARWVAFPVLGLGLGMALSLAGKRVGSVWLLATVATVVLAWILA